MDNHEKITILAGKSTISMAIFNSKLLVYQREAVTFFARKTTVDPIHQSSMFMVARSECSVGKHPNVRC